MFHHIYFAITVIDSLLV